jgi:F-type H+-transporting ATPase subunit delta
MEMQQIVRAEVTTAAPIPDERLEGLRTRLGEITGRQVTMTARVDPSLIAGIVTRIGSTVYDGSVSTQLATIRRKLAGDL